MKDLALESQVRGKERSGLLIVVDHFELFSSRQYQNFLYTILNGSQQHPWLVLLLSGVEVSLHFSHGSTSNHSLLQDCIQLLEKRVKSRLSTNRINFNVRMSPEQVTDAFHRFLAVCMPDEKENVFEVWNQLSKFSSRSLTTHFSSSVKTSADLWAPCYNASPPITRASGSSSSWPLCSPSGTQCSR